MHLVQIQGQWLYKITGTDLYLQNSCIIHVSMRMFATTEEFVGMSKVICLLQINLYGIWRLDLVMAAVKMVQKIYNERIDGVWYTWCFDNEFPPFVEVLILYFFN